MTPATCLTIWTRFGLSTDDYDFSAFCRGLNEEAREHPDFHLDDVAQIVLDHLDMRPGYYPDTERGMATHAARTHEDDDDERENPSWTGEEHLKLVELATRGFSQEGAAEELGRSLRSVKSKAQRERIKFYKGGWTKGQVAKLRSLAEHHSMKETAEALGRTLTEVQGKAKRLGISFGGRFVSASEVARNIDTKGATVKRWASQLGLLEGRGMGRGRTTPFEYEDVIELLDAILRGDVGGGGSMSRVTTKKVRDYRAKLLGEDLRQNPGAMWTHTSDDAFPRGDRIHYAAYQIVTLCTNQYAAYRATDPYLADDFLDDNIPDILVNDTLLMVNRAREALDNIEVTVGPIDMLLRIGTQVALRERIDKIVQHQHRHGNPFSLPGLYVEVANIMSLSSGGPAYDQESPWRRTFRDLMKLQTWQWLHNELVDPSKVDPQVIGRDWFNQLTIHIEACVRGLESWMRGDRPRTPEYWWRDET